MIVLPRPQIVSPSSAGTAARVREQRGGGAVGFSGIIMAYFGTPIAGVGEDLAMADLTALLLVLLIPVLVLMLVLQLQQNNRSIIVDVAQAISLAVCFFLSLKHCYFRETGINFGVTEVRCVCASPLRLAGC